MTYFPMGTIDASKFNSTKYPGVCKPMDNDTLQVVYDLQNQLNRLAKMKGAALIAVDGDIGPGTVALATKLGPWSHFASMMETAAPISTSSCTDVAQNADAIAAGAKSQADSLGAPEKVSGPAPAKPPTIITPSGQEVKGPAPAGASLLDSFKNLDTTTMLVLGGILVGGVVLLGFKPRGAASSSTKPSVRYRTRTRYIPRRRPRSRR
jgi:hypothetical protein